MLQITETEFAMLERAKLARRCYVELFAATDSFEGELGIQLAYLLGAILEDGRIELDPKDSDQAEVLDLFRETWKSDPHSNMPHAVWSHIRLSR